MWRLANYIYRTFRNVATHHCSQDIIIVPITTISNKDDEINHEKNEENLIKYKSNIYHIIENNQCLSKNFDKLQEYLHQISQQQLIQKPNILKSIETPKLECIVNEVPSIEKEETLESLLQIDEICSNTLKNLSELNNETISIINNQLAIEALETGNVQFGIETLQTTAKDGKNIAALYNLGICYEQGIGVEKDHAKACDYYRQASMLGHINAQFNLNNKNEDKKIEQTIPNKSRLFRLSFLKDYKEESIQSWNDYHFNLTKTLHCLS